MAQSNVVMAFRKRLKKCGYVGVKIRMTGEPGVFLVSAIEPLAGIGVQIEMTDFDMHYSMRMR